MPVPTDIDDLSQTAASNAPQGGEAVFPTLDNHLRHIYSFIAMLRDGDGFTAGAIGPEDISAIGDGSVSTDKIVDANVTYSKLATAVREALASPGDIKMCAYTSNPNGWLWCDGSAVSRVDYSDLFAAIGTTFGVGDGSTTFNLPDLRGEFVRGWDGGRGVDAGRVFGSAQSSQNLAHTHTASTGSGGSHSHDAGLRTEGSSSHVHDTATVTSGGRLDTTDGTSTQTGTTSTAGSHTHTVTVNSSGGTEARPRNVALLFVIKT
jgi:phage-related tail fiber protein